MSQSLVMDKGLEEAKDFARIMYIVHAVVFVFSLGSLSVIPLIINYVKRPYTQGTFVYSHHTWMIRTFWFALLWAVVFWILVFTLLGIPVAAVLYGVVWIWYVYRVIRGFIDLNNNSAMPV